MFRYLSMELSSECQLNCEWCARRIMKRTPGHMTMETASKVTSELPSFQYNLKYLMFCCWGEPVLNPDYAEIVRMITPLGIRTGISTNCVRFSNVLTRTGINEIFLHVSAGDGIRVRNAKKYIRRGNGNGKIFVLFLVTPSQQHLVEKFIDTFLPYACSDVKLLLKYPIVDEIADSYRPVREDLYKFESDNIIVTGKPYTPRKQHCNRCADPVVVLNDGTLVVECCRVDHEMKIGHVNDGIMNSYNSGKAMLMRNNFPNEGECVSCYNN